MSGIRNKSYEMDMCNGPLLGKILLFTLPLMASGILQLLFNAADMVVAGRWAGSVALGAVGATAPLINLLINVFMGLSVGANVAIAHFYGARREDEVADTVRTTMGLALVSGFVLVIIGVLLASPLLTLMGTPEEVLPHSVTYMKIFFLGMPATLVYNFGAAVLRAIGDTRRPLYYLSAAGVINIGLNMIFVIIMGMGVAGVAWATIISQTISAALVVRALVKSDGAIHLDIQKITLSRDKVIRIAQVGLPAGLQGAIFAISNVLIQSSVNSFGAIAVAGNTASGNIEGFVYNAMNSYHQTAISFAGQNMGARKYKRVHKTLWLCLMCVTVTGLVMGGLATLFGHQLISLYVNSSEVAAAEVIDFAYKRIVVIMMTYFLCGIMDSVVGVLRGMGYSIMPMIVSLLGACAFRIVWIFTIFRIIHTPRCLYVSYPISWALTFTVHMICFYTVAWPRIKRLRSQGGSDEE